MPSYGSQVHKDALEKEQRVQKAMEALNRKEFHTPAEAANHYNANLETLKRRLKGAKSAIFRILERHKINDDEDEVLQKWIRDIVARGVFPTDEVIRDMVDCILDRRTPVSYDTVDDNWVKEYLSRTPQIAELVRDTLRSGAYEEDEETIRSWFEILRKVMQQYDFSPADIYNVDEVLHVTAEGWTTAIECSNAAGTTLPPYLVMAFETDEPYVFGDDGRYDWFCELSFHGLTSDQSRLQWLERIFLPQLRTHRNPEKHSLLIFSGHGGQITPYFDEVCAAHNVVVVCLPANASNVLHPLDMKRKWRLMDANTKANREQVAFTAAYDALRRVAFEPETVKESFAEAGLVPFDPDRVLAKFEKSEFRTLPDLTHESMYLPTMHFFFLYFGAGTKSMYTLLDWATTFPHGIGTSVLNQCFKIYQMAVEISAPLLKRGDSIRMKSENIKQKRARFTMSEFMDLEEFQDHFKKGRVIFTHHYTGPLTIKDPITHNKRYVSGLCSICRMKGHTSAYCAQREDNHDYFYWQN